MGVHVDPKIDTATRPFLVLVTRPFLTVDRATRPFLTVDRATRPFLTVDRATRPFLNRLLLLLLFSGLARG